MVSLFREYTPNIQRFSVDECFLDFTGMENLYPDLKLLKEKIKSHGLMIWNYANGIENSDVRKSSHTNMKLNINYCGELIC